MLEAMRFFSEAKSLVKGGVDSTVFLVDRLIESHLDAFGYLKDEQATPLARRELAGTIPNQSR
jgi:hypothetical protein